MKRSEMICALFVSAFIFAASPFTTTGLSIFILAGQSNMAGRGGIYYDENNIPHWDGRIPPECQPDPQVLRLNDDLHWEEAKEPLHDGISVLNCSYMLRPGGIGPGMPFSNSLLKRDPTFGVIGLVPCAVGGTAIVEWSRGSCLYNRLLKRVRAAVLEGGVLRGMLWYQGETDAKTIENTRMYKTRLEAFFFHLRSDLLHPMLPIVQVALASSERNVVGNREIVREAQLNTSLANVKCVDAAGLPLNDDKLHLSTDSQLRLGSMMADVFLRFF